MAIPSVALHITRGLRLLTGIALLGQASAAEPTLKIEIASPPTIVFKWQKDRCNDLDLPDSTLRAFRRPDGSVVAFASHYHTRSMTGPSLRELRQNCHIVYKGADDPDPKRYDPKVWIAATWTIDGQSVAALAHNEYQAHRYPGRCAFNGYTACWYNFLTLLESDDGGLTFRKVEENAPLLAPAEPQEVDQGRPRGFFGSSNLVRYGDHIYGITMTTGGRAQARGLCLIRSSSALVPGSWEVLTDIGFTALRASTGSLSSPICKTLKNVHGDITALVRHRLTDTFLAIGILPGGPAKGDLVFSESKDLIIWTPPRSFFKLPTQFSTTCDSERFAYAALIDPDAKTLNFEDVGETAYLYMTRSNLHDCKQSLDRDLVRFEVRIGEIP